MGRTFFPRWRQAPPPDVRPESERARTVDHSALIRFFLYFLIAEVERVLLEAAWAVIR
jgi:hypothetical protein